MKKPKIHEQICKNCGKMFMSSTNRAKYCSPKCYGIAATKRKEACIDYDWVLDMSKPIKEWKWTRIDKD